MRKFSSLIVAILLTTTSFSQIDSIHQRIFLIGDAGELHDGHQPVLDWLKKNVNWNDEKNIAIFLGDNIYELGLPMEGEADYEISKKVLDYQIDLVRGKRGKAFFVLGNHDWNNGKMGGWQRAINQEDYINGLDQSNIKAYPTDGCPGPVAVDISDKVAVVFIDSQWFLYVHEKPGPGSDCVARTIDEFATELKEIVATHQNQLLIFAMHHPAHTYGPHGGDYTWKEHLFPFTAINPSLYIPLPVLGSIYPVARGVFGSIQDIRHPLYQTMVETIVDVMKEHRNPIQVAGHDHSLQMIMKDSIPYIISGSGIKLTRVTRRVTNDLLYADVNHNGFAMLEVRKSGRVEAKFYTVESAGLNTPTFVKEIKKIDTIPTKISRDSIPLLPDSVLAIANPKLKAGGFKKLLMGRNYREEWTTPVRVQVLNLGKEQGGLTPTRQGGGKQTRSLRVVDKSGKEWALRSVEKYPEAAIPPDLRQTVVKDIVEDGISASYPYASLSVNPLASAVGVPTLKRKLVYIPDDPRLGRFRDLFKNTLAILEERQPGNFTKSDNTQEVVLKLAKDNDDRVDQVAVLKARLLDNFYMDLDRHEDQWQWTTRDTGKGKIYVPFPRDPDQVFFVNQGIIPSLVKKTWIAPELQGFEPEADNIKTFNKPARNFDRFFLTELDEETWSRQIDTFLMKMTDQVIENAINQQPREIRNFNANDIIRKLKARRNYFKDEMLRYYRFISEAVNIVGSNQRELFAIDKLSDGKVQVQVNKIDKQNAISSQIYKRTFDPEVTKELRIYGLQDADSFVIRGGNTPVKIRIIGGPGKDHFANEGNGGTVIVYDVNFEENKFSGNEAGLINKISADPRANQYTRLFYKYNYFNPNLSVAWNVDDGLFLGAKGELVRQGFRKEPYAMRQVLIANHALRTSSYRFNYEGEFIRLLGNNDLYIRGDVRAPVNVTNFFGFGNNTEFDKTKPGAEQYYRARYNIANASFFLRRQLQSWMRVNIGPSLQYYHLEEHQNRNRYVSTVLRADSATMYNRKWFVGADGLLDINSRNNDVLPSRGFLMNAGVRSLFGVSSARHNLTQLYWDMSVIASFVPNARVVYAVRFGGGTNFGSFEIPQAQYLSGTENLRGYRRNRFAGRTMLYQNTEVRIKLADFSTYLFPGSIGLHLFHDIGRVWMENERSRRWHNGYGAGLWLSPIKRFVVTGSVVHSKEEKLLPYFTFGFQF